MTDASLMTQMQSSLFMVLHGGALVVAAFFAWRAFSAGRQFTAWSLVLLALAQVAHASYHLNPSAFFLGHTVAETLTMLAIVLLGAAGGVVGDVRERASERA
jgi:hypothetical protein